MTRMHPHRVRSPGVRQTKARPRVICAQSAVFSSAAGPGVRAWAMRAMSRPARAKASASKAKGRAHSTAKASAPTGGPRSWLFRENVSARRALARPSDSRPTTWTRTAP